jgi:hypothetical protein
MGSNLVRHRQSLGLRLERVLRRGRRRLAAWLALPGRALAALAAALMRLVQVRKQVGCAKYQGLKDTKELCRTEAWGLLPAFCGWW